MISFVSSNTSLRAEIIFPILQMKSLISQEALILRPGHAGRKWWTRAFPLTAPAGARRPAALHLSARPGHFARARGLRGTAAHAHRKSQGENREGQRADRGVCSLRTDRWIPAARRRRGRGGGGGCRRARGAGRRQARGDERRAPGEGAAPGDRLQPRRAPRPRPAPPPLPGAEAAARAGAAL